MITRDNLVKDQLDLFWWFVCERQRIWSRRVRLRQSPPWTEDPVLQRERFTNVYRELDPGTQYAIKQVLERDEARDDRIFNVMIYRLIGRSATHAELGFQRRETFDPVHIRDVLSAIRQRGQTPFTAAYMVSAYTSMGTRDKIENVTRLFTALNDEFDRLMAVIDAAQSSQHVHSALASAYGFGRFLAFQVLVDLLYPLNIKNGHPLLPFSHDDWAIAGPGAQRGISLLAGNRRNKDQLAIMRWLRENQRSEFKRLDLAFPYLRDRSGGEFELSLANIQNCLCEFHKYVKIRDGTGRGRRRFDDTCAYNTDVSLRQGRLADRLPLSTPILQVIRD